MSYCIRGSRKKRCFVEAALSCFSRVRICPGELIHLGTVHLNNAIQLALFTVEKIVFFLMCFIRKIRRRSFEDVTKNSVFVVARLKNHEKYSPCLVDFLRD